MQMPIFPCIQSHPKLVEKIPEEYPSVLTISRPLTMYRRYFYESFLLATITTSVPTGLPKDLN